jgi:hypothetical protein
MRRMRPRQISPSPSPEESISSYCSLGTGVSFGNSGGLHSEPGTHPQSRGDNVTHRLCTHRLHGYKMSCNAPRHPHQVWPRHPTHSRGAEDQSGRGCGAVRAAPDVLQWHRARDSECVTGEHWEDRQRAEDEPAGPLRARLSHRPPPVYLRYAADIRAWAGGRPHPRHWQALAELVGVSAQVPTGRG